MINLFSMSGAHLIRASKQSLGIRMAVACHLSGVLGQAVDPECLDVALEAFYCLMDGTSLRTDDVDLIEVTGSSSTRVNDQLIWSRKSMPMVKILKMEFFEEAPTDNSVKDAWTIKAVIEGNTISLVDSGVEAFTMEGVDQSQAGDTGVSPSRRRKVTVPEELLSDQRDMFEHVQSPLGAGQGHNEVTASQGVIRGGGNHPAAGAASDTVVDGGEGEPKTDLDSNMLAGLMEGLEKLEVNPDAERSASENDVSMQSTQQTVIKAPTSVGHGPFGDVLGSFRNHPEEFNTSKDLDESMENSSSQNHSDQQPSGGRSHAVTLVPSKLQTGGVPRRTGGPRDGITGGLSETEARTPLQRKIPAPSIQAEVPSQYYSLSETFGPVQWQRQMSDCVQSTAVKKQATLQVEDVANGAMERLPRFPQPVGNRNEADKTLGVTYGAHGHSNSIHQQGSHTERSRGNDVHAQLVQPAFSGQPAHQSVQPIPQVQSSRQRQAIMSSQSDDWLQYEKQKYLAPQMKPWSKTEAPGYTSGLTPTPEDLPSSNPVNEPQVFMMKSSEPKSTGVDQSIPHRSEQSVLGQQPSQVHLGQLPSQVRLDQPSCPEGRQSLLGQQPSQAHLGQLPSQVHLGQPPHPEDQLQSGPGHMLGHQGQLHNPRSRQHQGWNSDRQGNLIGHPSRPLDHQVRNESLQDKSQNQTMAQDITVADLSKMVSEMAKNSKPKEQLMRIQSSVQYPHFDPASEDDAEMAIASLSVLRDLGYNTAALVIGFCYQNSLSELLLALTKKQKTDFNAFEAEFRRWYGVNPATAQAQYDRLRQKPGENEIALFERISRLFRQVEGRSATEADNYKLGQKFIDSLTDEKTALQLRSKFLRDEYRSISELIREAISMRQAVETQKIRLENRKQELKALLANLDEPNSDPLVATSVQGQRACPPSGNSLERPFCKRCHVTGHAIEECTPPQDLWRFSRYCSFHGWGYHDSHFCKSKMRPPIGASSHPKQAPVTWAERHEQGVSCSRCGGPHEVSLCRANAKQVNNHNKVKNGSRPSQQEVRFDVPAKYNSIPSQSFHNEKTLFTSGNLDGDQWEMQYDNGDQWGMQYDNEHQVEYGFLGYSQDEGYDWS